MIWLHEIEPFQIETFNICYQKWAVIERSAFQSQTNRKESVQNSNYEKDLKSNLERFLAENVSL